MKKLTIFISIIFMHTPAHGMWKTFFAKAALHKKILATATVGTLTGTSIGYAKRDDIKEFHVKISEAPINLRLNALESSFFKPLKNTFPYYYHTLVIEPLFAKIRYKTLDEYVQEPDEKTKERQKLVQRLCLAGVPLDLTQTEADILTVTDSAYKKNRLLELSRQITMHEKEFGEADKDTDVSPAMHSVINRAFMHEQHMNRQEMHTLYHSMHTSIYAANYIGTQLQTIEQPNADYLCFRQNLPYNSLKKEEEKREELLNRPSYNTEDDPIKWLDHFDNYEPLQQKLVSCSPAISSHGAMSYFSQGSSGCFGVKVTFDTHTVPKNIIKKYQKKLLAAQDALIRTEKPSTVLLQISMNSKLADKTVYPSMCGGYKLNVFTKAHPQEKFEKMSPLFAMLTQNPCNVHNHVRNLPSSGAADFQLRMIVDKSLLLDPNNPEVRDGFKVKAFAANQDALDTFHKDVETIVSDIRKEMHQQKGA